MVNLTSTDDGIITKRCWVLFSLLVLYGPLNEDYAQTKWIYRYLINIIALSNNISFIGF